VGGVGSHAAGRAEEIVEPEPEDEMPDEHIEEHRNENDGSAQNEEERTCLLHRREKLRPRRHADLCEKQREAEISQNEIGGDRHRPDPPPASAYPAENESHHEWPTRYAESKDSQPGDRDWKNAQKSMPSAMPTPSDT